MIAKMKPDHLTLRVTTTEPSPTLVPAVVSRTGGGGCELVVTDGVVSGDGLAAALMTSVARL